MMDNVCIVAKYLDRGPGKLVWSLKNGFNKRGIQIVSRIEETDHVACLQWGDDWPDVNELLGKRALVGPNTWESPSEKPEIIAKLHNFIVPSQWVKDKHEQEPLMKDKQVHIWSGGIDTNAYAPISGHKEVDCLIYLKNRSTEDYDKLAAAIQTFYGPDAKLAIFEYGHYNEKDFHAAVQNSKMAILCTNTESQGYAYMNMLSANLPCLVFNKDTLVSRDGSKSWAATSVPYFDERCGVIENDISADTIEKFVAMGRCWAPREYILENHTIDISTDRYIELLTNARVL
jgi:hypothetical protein